MNLHYKQQIVPKSNPLIGGTGVFCIQIRITRFRVSIISFLRKIFGYIIIFI